MDRKPLVSAVIPTFNRAQKVVAAIESVRAQTWTDLEIIVVDDGSTDGTVDAIESIADHNFPHLGERPAIRYVYQTNKGPSYARNTGIEAARGDWIAFLDSDDIWFPEKIERQLRAIEQFKGQCGACISNARLISAHMDTTTFSAAEKRFYQPVGSFPQATAALVASLGGIWIQTLLARRDLVNQIGGFDTDLDFAEDQDFLFRLSLATCFCYVNMPLAIIDRNTAATDSTVGVRAWDSVEFRLRAKRQMYEKWLISSRHLSADVKKRIIRSLRAIDSTWANLYLQRGQFDLARHAISKALSRGFTVSLAAKWTLAVVAPSVAKKLTEGR